MNVAMPLMPARRVDLRVLVALLAVYVIWGSTYLAIRVALVALPPWGMAGSRFVVAGLAALAIAHARKEALPSLRDWLFAVPAGICLFVFGNGLVVVAEQTLPSSVAAVVAATTPLFAGAMNAVRGERPSRGEAAGMLLGLVGVAVLVGATSFHGAGLLVLAPIGFAFGSLLVRSRGKKGSALSVAAPQMVTGGVAMLGMSIAMGERVPALLPVNAFAAWVYLVVFGSLVGFTAYAWLLRHARPAVSLSYAYVNPVLAVILGAVVGGEALGRASFVALALIGAGVLLAVSSRSRQPAQRS
jgi:drug/metabolite transporter (DMT)-like permease